ncbi:MAG: amidohydrolase family protein, partial [Planctomycetes bacterium]|nr:amidohydrolase family protein [Planctomycetota bacterium]
MLLFGSHCAVAQTDGIAKFQPRVLAVINARIVTQPGTEITRGTLLIRDGLIVAVGKDVTVPPDADVIEGENLHVYAGFIDAAAYDFLDPAKKPTTSAGRKVDFSRYVLAATRPDNRRGLTPEHLATNQLKLDAKTQETVRKLGFTAVHVLPQSRIAGGQGTLISTAGVPVREAVLSESTFTEFQLFAMRGGSNSTSAYPSTLMGATAHLRQAFLDARRYSRHWKLYRNGAKRIERPPTDPMLESLANVLEKNRRVVFRAHSRDDIHRALDFCNEFDLPATLWGGREAYKCIDRIKKHNVALITQIDFGDEPKIEPNTNSEKFTADFKPPLRVQEDRQKQWKKRVAGLGRFEQAKIPFAISSSGLKDRSELLKNLRLAITEGLSRQAALSALTLDAARILGIEKRLGTLAAGKLAHVVVMTGPFDHEKSKVRYVLIDGNKYEYNSEAKPVVQDPAVATKPEPAGNTSENRSEADLAGTWNMKIDTADGTLSAVLTLTQNGDRLEGTFTSDHGNGKLTSGSISEKRAEFVVSIGAGDRDVKLKFETNGTGENGKLSGVLKPAFGAATQWTATRTAGSNSNARSSVHVAQSDKNDNQSKAKKSSSDKTPSEVASKNDSELPSELKSDRLKRPFQTGGNVLITNATVLTGTEQTLLNSSILVKNGKIAAIGTGLKPEPGMKVIDASNRFVMPGIIDTHSHIMISGGVNESTQSIVPEVRIKDTVNTDDVSEYRALAGGVTVARLFHGSANVIGVQ